MDFGEIVAKLRLRFDIRFRRGWTKKLGVIDYYNRVASGYDAQYAEEQHAKIRVALNRVKPHRKSFILDIGCGTGFLFEYLGESVRLLVGVDISKEILRKAKKRAKPFSNVNIILADADFLPFPNGLFDVVFAFTLLQNVPNPLLTLDEMKRVGKIKSILVITGFKKFQIYRHFYRSTFSRLLKEAGLQTSDLVEEDQLKDFVAVCRLRDNITKTG